MTEVDAAAEERLAAISQADEVRRAGPHIWATLGYRRVDLRPGSTTVEWDAEEAYGFPTAAGPIVQGGMITALLDAAMGGACWTVLDADQAFLTADLRVEFLRSCRPGTLRAVGEVVRRTRRVVFCSAQLYDSDGVVLAASRCTQVVMPADGRAGRYVGDPATGAVAVDAAAGQPVVCHHE
jgi:uncharacterized protein (TIGR00369 family)